MTTERIPLFGFLTRRGSLGWIAAATVLPSMQARAQADAIVLGQTVALTGPLADLGRAISTGAKVYFDALNAQGGIKGRQVKLITLDDGYDVKRSQENIKQLTAEKGFMGLFTVMGTPMIEAALPMLRETGTMLFAPFTGALVSRPKDIRNVLPIRASYPDEVVQLVKHLTTIGIKKIALVTQNNSFGNEVLASALAAMEKQSLKPVAQNKVQSDASDAAAAADKTAAAVPEAVIVGLAGKPALEFIKAVRVRQRGLSLYALSILGAAGTIRAMGVDGEGVTITQVVPMPNRESITVVREFRQAFVAAKTDVEPSHLALEGYLNAKAFALIASRLNGSLTGKAIVEAAWATKRLDLGGYEIGFSEPGNSASRFIELTMISKTGFLR
jgi:branched-chain amino acid transport system substrate-binding protein